MIVYMYICQELLTVSLLSSPSTLTFILLVPSGASQSPQPMLVIPFEDIYSSVPFPTKCGSNAAEAVETIYNADLELGWVNRKQCTKDLEKGDVSELRQWFVEEFGGI